MSGNSCLRAFVTAPMVSAFSRRPSAVSIIVSSAGRSRGSMCPSALPLQERQLVLADLKLVAVGELVRLDASPVDVRAVERPEVVEVEVAAALDHERVVARDRHVVEEDVGVRAAADRHTVALERK